MLTEKQATAVARYYKRRLSTRGARCDCTPTILYATEKIAKVTCLCCRRTFSSDYIFVNLEAAEWGMTLDLPRLWAPAPENIPLHLLGQVIPLCPWKPAMAAMSNVMACAVAVLKRADADLSRYHDDQREGWAKRWSGKLLSKAAKDRQSEEWSRRVREGVKKAEAERLERERNRVTCYHDDD